MLKFILGLSLIFQKVILTVSTPTTIPPTNVPTMQPAALIPPNCNIVLPPFPLSYQGLITPYQLQTIDPNTPCAMKTFPAFAEALIFDLDTHSFSIYHPLIVDFQTTPLVQPLTFTMPQNSIVSIHFGSNGMAIKLFPPASVQQGNCVYGIGGTTSIDQFGQFSHCNAVDFFEKIKTILLSNVPGNVPLNPPIPDLGLASDGLPCPTVRDFFLVDMDPSDNVLTTYLVDMNTGRTAQNNLANQQANPQAVVLKNGSDNLLLSTLDKIMGCKPYQVPNLVDINNPLNSKISSMALDEIHAAIRQEKIYAYLPKGDPMTRVMVNNALQPSLLKLNLYRQGVFQPMVNDLKMADTTLFCVHFSEIQIPRLQKNKDLFINQPSPDPAISPHMFGFLANRFSASYIGLNCPILLDVPNPVTLVMNNQLVVDAIFSQIQPFPKQADDPYLLSWDEYPSFAPETPEPTTQIPEPTTQSPTPEPTTQSPTTHVPEPTTHMPVPTTHTPTTSPVPTTKSPENNSSFNLNTMLYIISGCVSVILILSAVIWHYCKRQPYQPVEIPQILQIIVEESPSLSPPRTPKNKQLANPLLSRPRTPIKENKTRK